MKNLRNNPVYYTAAAQRPDKQIKFDFFLMHGVNSTIFLSKIVSLPFISAQNKARLLEFKGRMDLVLYASRGAPNLYPDEITGYPISKNWNELFSHSIRDTRDDGHLPKLLRAVASGEQICRPFESQATTQHGLKVAGDMWLKIGNMGKQALVTQ